MARTQPVFNLNGQWYSVSEKGDRQACRIEHKGNNVIASYLRPRVCMPYDAHEAQPGDSGPTTMICAQLTISGKTLTGSTSVCRTVSDDSGDHCSWEMVATRAAVSADGNSIVGTWADFDDGGPMTYTLERLGVRITRLEFFELRDELMLGEKTQAELPLEFFGTHTYGDGRGKVQFHGLIEIEGPEHDVAAAITLEVLGAEGKLLRTLQLASGAGASLLKAFGKSGKLTIKRKGNLAPVLFESDARPFAEICAAGEYHVVLRVKVTTKSGSEAMLEYGQAKNLVCLEKSIAALEKTANQFGLNCILDAAVRQRYVRRTKLMSQRVLKAVLDGEMPIEEGVQFSNQLRDEIMKYARRQASVLGTAIAKGLKDKSPSVAKLLQKKASSMFLRQFEDLSPKQRERVFKGVITSSGSSRPAITRMIPVLKGVGAACLIFSWGVVVFNVWTAENKVKALLSEMIQIGSSSILAQVGAEAGLLFGPAAPFVCPVLFVVGGIMGAALSSEAVNSEFWDECAHWLMLDDTPLGEIVAPVQTAAEPEEDSAEAVDEEIEALVREGPAGPPAEERIAPGAVIPTGSWYVAENARSGVVHFSPNCPALDASIGEIHEETLDEAADPAQLASELERPACGTCLRMRTVSNDTSPLFWGGDDEAGIEIWRDRIEMWGSDGYVVFAAADLLSAEPRIVRPRLLLKFPNIEIDYSFPNREHRDAAYQAALQVLRT